ncbi:hypothetical protein J1605_010162 [Eschrichtius robustus]|uniref:Uncharacterized protein n=1 Tax=Eschrichtius robustus TaxID=9764 RepID=A0AB34GSL9_ESCRO|nr:hypothetical protein J1605_010162 [Eschrichtius robustus]
MWDLPGPGLEPVSPALAGGFLTTVPLGKSPEFLFLKIPLYAQFRLKCSRRAGSVIVAHGPSCSAACGMFPDQGSNPCPLHWQADSQPLRHQGSPTSLSSLIIS